MQSALNFNAGKIRGGDWASSVPAWCDVDCRMGVLPGQDLEAAKAEIAACVVDASRDHPFLSNNPPEIEWNGFFARGYLLPEGTEAETTLIDAHRAVHGERMTAEMSTAYLDGRVFMLYDDCPALVYGPVSENIHGFDERVSLASTREVTRTVALFVARWCGLNAL